VTVDVLPDNVLLETFDSYLLEDNQNYDVADGDASSLLHHVVCI